MYSIPAGMSMSSIQARKDRRGKRAELPDEIAKRLKSCSVLNCEDWRDLTSYTTYHCFPTGDKNQDRWEVWTQLLRKAREDETWIPFRGSLVCSHHFRPEDFVSDPLSKRRKLIKNAIPSIFPTFTVDLDDPAYQFADDEDQPGSAEYQMDNSNEYGDVNQDQEWEGEGDVEGLYGYEDYPSAEGQLYEEEDQTIFQASGDFDEEDDDDVQILEEGMISHSNSAFLQPTVSTVVGKRVSNVQIKSSNNMPTLLSRQGSSSSPPNLLKRKSHNQPIIQVSDKVLQGKRGGSNLIAQSSSNGERQQQQQRLQPLTKLAPAPASSSSFQSGRNGQRRRISPQVEETVAALNSLPFSLNPDLEIEMVDPEEDLAVCRQRVSELEQQNRSLTTMYENALEDMKEKYERQIALLRKRLQQQDRLLANNQVSTSFTLAKKVRLS